MSRTNIILFVIALILLSFHATSQRIIKTVDLPKKSAFQDLIVLPDNSTLSIVNMDSLGYTDFKLLKLSPAGDVIWSSSSISGAGLFLKEIDGAYFVGGTSGLAFWRAVPALFKYDYNGNLLWVKKYSKGFISSIAKMENGDFYIGGKLDRNGSSSNSAIYKIDEDGNVLDSREFDLYSNSSLRYIFEDGENLILIFSASTVGVGFEGHVIIKLNPATGEEIWRLDKYLGYYEDDFPIRGVGRNFGAAINSNNEVVVSAPANRYGNSLVYRTSNNGNIIDEFSTFNVTQGAHPHDLVIMNNGDYLLSGIFEDSESSATTYVERRKTSGEIVWRRHPTPGTLIKSKIAQDTIYLVGLNKDFNTNAFYQPLFVKMTTDGKLYNHDVSINIFEDANGNCIINDLDLPLNGIRTFIGERTAYSNQHGEVQYDLDTGIYSLTLDLPPYLSLCDNTNEIITVTDTVGHTEHTRLVQANDCKELSVGLTYTELIRCQNSRIYVQYENSSLHTISNTRIKLEIDGSLNLSAASMNYSNDNNTLVFNTGDVPPLTSDRIWLDIYTPCKTDLFSVKCLDASIEPQYECDSNNNHDLSKFILNSSCANGVTTIDIFNNNELDIPNVEYELYNDGHKFEEGSLDITAQEHIEFSFETNGNTLTLKLQKELDSSVNATESISIEGCGQQSNGIYSKGFKRMLDRPYGAIWDSKACLEVQDNYSGHRVFEINRGRGYYHAIDTTANSQQFSMRYKNDLNETIQNLDITLSPNSIFDRNSFKELASSHNVISEYNSVGQMTIRGENLNIGIGEEFHYRFGYDTPVYESESNGFASVGVSGVFNRNNQLDIATPFYNLLSFENALTDTISPYTYMNDGFLFGRGNTWEFYGDMELMENGNIIIGGTAYEANNSSQLYLITSNAENKVLWEKSYSFEEGSPYLEDILPVENGTVLLLGGVDLEADENTFSRNYAFILAIDQEGEEIWRKVWRPGAGSYGGGSLKNGVYTSSGKIILGGYKFIERSPSNFVIEIDLDGNTLWSKDIVIGNDFVNYEFAMKSGANNEIYCGGHESGNPSYFAITKLDENGNELLSGKYLYEIEGEGGTITIVDFEHTDDNQIVLVGSGYSYDENPTEISYFGRIAFLDESLNLNNAIDVFQGLPSFSLTSITVRDSFLHVGGDWSPDATFSRDAFMAKLSLNGNVEWMSGKDLGAKEYSNKILSVADGKFLHSIQTQTQDNIFNLQMGYWMFQDTTYVTSTSKNIEEALTFKLFPNPTSALIHIEGDIQIDEVMVFSMEGRRVNILSQSTNTYNVAHLNSGVYLIVIRDKKGIRRYQKFVKN